MFFDIKTHLKHCGEPSIHWGIFNNTGFNDNELFSPLPNRSKGDPTRCKIKKYIY